MYSPTVEESVSNDRVYRLDYRNVYSQVGTIRQERNITTTLIDPETMQEMRQQMSFVGSCLNPNLVGQICTFMQGIATDNNSIDPQKQIPTNFRQTSKFGDVVTPESLAAMRQPGFQSGANGQELGTDLYFPKVGTRAGNSQTNISSAERFESTTTVPTASFGRVRQTITTNGTQTQIARTVRGFNFVFDDRNTWANTGIQAMTELFPDIQPSVAPGQKGRSTSINRNLLLAANNNRIPDNSLTAYYVGIGSGNTPENNQVLAANYHGIWVGFSPAIERNISTSKIYQPTGAEKTTLASGGEGGVNRNTDLTVAIDRNLYASQGITNSYVQTYLTTYDRDANALNGTQLREKTNYYPHITATGNVTTKDSVVRYYTGFILNPNNTNVSEKIYGGLDFS